MAFFNALSESKNAYLCFPMFLHFTDIVSLTKDFAQWYVILRKYQ